MTGMKAIPNFGMAFLLSPLKNAVSIRKSIGFLFLKYSDIYSFAF